MEKSIVTELEGDGQDLDSAIPSNKPSVLLFVDRSSDLSETRRRSKAVLDGANFPKDALTAAEDKSHEVLLKNLPPKRNVEYGFQGLIYNKHMRWDTLQELEEESKLLKEALLSFSGPLVTRGMPLVALTRRAVGSQYPEVAPGTYFLGQSATLHEIEEIRSGNQRVSDYWFFLGFSSWGWDQLFDEIAQGAGNLSEEHEKELLDWPWLY
ncbi:TRANSPORTER putative-RELATED [Salix purpurea]|uniref:TRANSPORTER putative-RELATED n=1 Tax=Salix purpurea TaxID=77065 RepID=A0A9Q0V278_SALPP|nr:TRANSPORTER putative-RELATED [Salix purpurea]